MTATAVTQRPRTLGEDMHALIAELYPICRSITGDGFRESLRRIQDEIPLTLEEVPSGTPVFDWTVPKEWNIRDAYIKNSRGERVVDFQRSNLHVVNYSVPVRRRLSLAELTPHLYTLPDHPDWIPYRTSYYAESWGFCLTHRQFLALEDVEYEVCIDATLEDGHLTYGEVRAPRREPRRDSDLLSLLPPSLANDNLSGMAVAVFLAQHLSRQARRCSFRFLFIPGTIGSITWLALNRDAGAVHPARVGAVLSGRPRHAHLQAESPRRCPCGPRGAHVLSHGDGPYTLLDFVPYGYDERQYCSPASTSPWDLYADTQRALSRVPLVSGQPRVRHT